MSVIADFTEQGGDEAMVRYICSIGLLVSYNMS